MRVIISILCLIGMGSSLTQAAPIKYALNDAAEYNLITRENISVSSADSQGIIAVGGNATIDHYDVGVLGSDKPVLQVNGNLTAAGDQVVKGDAIVKGNYINESSSPWHNPIAEWRSLSDHGGIDIEQTFKDLSAFSETLATLPSNTSQIIDSTLLTVGADRDSTYGQGLFVSNIHLSTLNTLTGMGGERFSDADYLVFNIASDEHIDLNSFDIYPSLPSRSNILFNFFNAQSITFSNGNINGHILAPNADFNFETGLITGGVYVNSFQSTAGAQLNFDGSFGGEFTFEQEANEINEINEPSSSAMVLLALFCLISLRFSRAKTLQQSLISK